MRKKSRIFDEGIFAAADAHFGLTGTRHGNAADKDIPRRWKTETKQMLYRT